MRGIKDNGMKFFSFGLVILLLISKNGFALENVTSNCSWKPQRLSDLSGMITLEFPTPSDESSWNRDLLLVTERRLYFHSLPNKSCRSDLFVIKGEIVEGIDMLPDMSWVRVTYYSNRLSKTIVGWVESKGLCRKMRDGFKRCYE